ncbi:hypothetical protein [Ellagibacter isourolithinifaciens]|uniref:hypothetical protein n=1 Tax=Ellagibacter isourolithinifaciens TaxID=2137581 RepID=UPI003AAE03AD
MAKMLDMQKRSALFGETSLADGIPEAFLPTPDVGPIVFEGMLLLDRSFLGDEIFECPEGDLVETLRLYDVLEERWCPQPIEIKRYEYADVVEIEGKPVWIGSVDTRMDAVGTVEECANSFWRWRHFV